MTKMDQLRSLTEIDYLEIVEEYESASDYLRRGLKMSENGRYIKFISDKLRQFNIEWNKTPSLLFEKTCPVCSKLFKTYKNSREQSTCSYSCANTHFRSGKNNGMYQQGIHRNYRNHAFLHYGKACMKCGLADEEVLVVHHINRDRDNNDISNLMVLCANCHMKEHRV